MKYTDAKIFKAHNVAAMCIHAQLTNLLTNLCCTG